MKTETTDRIARPQNRFKRRRLSGGIPPDPAVANILRGVARLFVDLFLGFLEFGLFGLFFLSASWRIFCFLFSFGLFGAGLAASDESGNALLLD